MSAGIMFIHTLVVYHRPRILKILMFLGIKSIETTHKPKKKIQESSHKMYIFIFHISVMCIIYTRYNVKKTVSKLNG